ncbi:MAG: SUMF1/EgtB/PvdO family nonheme iron enzyme [Luteolibacter sp.]
MSEETPTFGDYVPKNLLGEDHTTRTWLAEQPSIGRMVLIEELKESATKETDSFMADARAKAAVEYPLLNSIYEASTENGRCFFAQELLPGKTLGDRHKAGEKIDPLCLVYVLQSVADANIYHETQGNATSVCSVKDIHVDEHDVVRIRNLAIAGERLADHSVRDVFKLGEELTQMVDQDQPGATRCLTLLSWMRGEEIQKHLTWDEVRGYCEEIERQLRNPAATIALPTSALRPKKRFPYLIPAVAALLVIGAVIGIILMPERKKPVRKAAERPGMVSIEKGKFKTPGGMTVNVTPFQISSHEVTIGEYAEFLSTLELLAKSDSGTVFDHSEQPPEKTNHQPDRWTSFHPVAQQRGTYEGREIGLNTPVVGIDWWDAYAYAKWQKASLPTRQQWLGALMSGAKLPAALPVSEWLPVHEDTPDQCSNGLRGMAGSVSEWTLEKGTNPSNPLGKPLWIIVGGSFETPAQGALTTQWVADRSLRRPDLGFRICR